MAVRSSQRRGTGYHPADVLVDREECLDGKLGNHHIHRGSEGRDGAEERKLAFVGALARGRDWRRRRANRDPRPWPGRAHGRRGGVRWPGAPGPSPVRSGRARDARAQSQRRAAACSLTQGNLKTLSQMLDHLRARAWAPSLDEAQMPSGDVSRQCQVELAEPAPLAPDAQQWPHTHFGDAGHDPNSRDAPVESHLPWIHR